jgi:hypothetical protein
MMCIISHRYCVEEARRRQHGREHRRRRRPCSHEWIYSKHKIFTLVLVHTGFFWFRAAVPMLPVAAN